MKRSAPPKRKKPLPRNKKPLSRSGKRLVRSALRRSTKKIRAKGLPRFKRGRDPQYLEWIRGLPCICKGRFGLDELCKDAPHICTGAIQAMHVSSRGAGGKDVGNVVPGCFVTHGSQHTIGIQSWATRWFKGGLAELRRIAAETYPQMYERYQRLGWTGNY